MSGNVNRRSFLAGMTALSYSRVSGANNRISLGHIGVGSRGRELDGIAANLRQSHNVEMIAVCDLWKVNRERAAALAEKTYGRSPRAFQYMEDLLALKDVDAVLISTGDFQHAPILKVVVDAGKDAYCEKPMANDLNDAKAARAAVRAGKQVVQIGTQHRSEPYEIAVRDVIRSGAVGDVSKVEMVWNYHGPRWRGRPEVSQIREQDTDWRRWLLSKPYRPFDPRAYFEFRLYRDFSGGITDQWMSHGSDLVHFFLDDHFPHSAVANGGIFAWHDGRENPDTFQALLTYPKGFMFSFSTSFGNDSPSFSRIMGKKATLMNIGGEGSPRWKIVEEVGRYEDNPFLTRPEKWVLLPGDSPEKLPPTFIPDSAPFHMTNWFEAIRARKDPDTPVEAGFSHSVACIMATRAYREGRKLYWSPRTESIVTSEQEI